MNDKNGKKLRVGDLVLVRIDSSRHFGNSFVAKIREICPCEVTYFPDTGLYREVPMAIIQTELVRIRTYSHDIEVLPRQRKKRNEQLLLLKMEGIKIECEI